MSREEGHWLREMSRRWSDATEPQGLHHLGTSRKCRLGGPIPSALSESPAMEADKLFP